MSALSSNGSEVTHMVDRCTPLFRRYYTDMADGKLTRHQKALLTELDARPIPVDGHDQRRPFAALATAKLICKRRRIVDQKMVWTLSTSGRRVLETLPI